MPVIETTTRYAGHKRFASGTGPSRVVMDAKVEVGGLGEALTPKQLVLQGLLGCTGMDVATVLEKKGVAFAELALAARAETTTTNPQRFKTIHVVYSIRASEADRPHVLRAIELSESTFCGVSASLRAGAEITSELVLEPL